MRRVDDEEIKGNLQSSINMVKKFCTHTEKQSAEGSILLDKSRHEAHMREMRNAHKTAARTHEMESEL
jgi:hypothetical protein